MKWGKIMKKNLVKSNLFLLLSLIIIVLISILLYLYNSYLIFVKQVEHGILTNKQELVSTFKYDIFIDGKSHIFTTQDKSIDINLGVINFKYRNDNIVKFIGYVAPIKEKIMAKEPSLIDLEYSGRIEIAKKTNYYRILNNEITNKSINSIIVGANNISLYKDLSGRIKTIIINGDTNLNFLRIGIKNEDFQSFDHTKIELSCDKGIKIMDKKDNKIIYISPNVKATITPIAQGITIISDSDAVIFNNRIYVQPQDTTALIKLLSFNRSYGLPTYRGNFEITVSSDKLNLINEVDIENYLYQVVPSEMPSSFGLEALKAQSVAARTYAISDLISSRYASKGFHVDDSTMSQVYNNIKENSQTTKAVNETKGLVMKYDGEFIDAMYYSTSHGYGAKSGEIWSSDGTFPGNDKPYFTASNYLLNKEQFNLSSEEDAVKFFKSWSLKGYDSVSPYFRWSSVMTKAELTNTIEKNLPLTYNDQKNYILTLVNGNFLSKIIPQNCIGDLQDMKVTKRGEGGNIMELVVFGTNGTYKIVKELNVRYVIRPRKADTGFDNDIIIKRIKGGDLKNNSLLPSAFMIFDINKDAANNIKNITFYGGGYGHGVGMSQYGAGYLASINYTFDKILQTYYKDIKIEKLY